MPPVYNSQYVNLVRPDGTTIAAKPEEVDALVSLGYRPETAMEGVDRGTEEVERDYYTSGLQTFATGVEGVISGAFMGALDPVLEASIGEGFRKRAEYNPGTRLGTEILGAVVPALLTGGESIAARIAEGTPAGLLERGGRAVSQAVGGGVKGAAAKGAVEGVVMGAGAEVTRATLTDEPLTVEGVLAGATLGGFFGVGAGALGSMLETGATKLGQRLEAEAADHVDDAMERAGVAEQLGQPERRFVVGEDGAVKVEGKAERPPPVRRDLADRPLATEAIMPEETFRSFRGAVKDTITEATRLANDADEMVAKIAKSKPLRESFAKVNSLGDQVYSDVLATKARGSQAALSEVSRSYRAAKNAVVKGTAEQAEEALKQYHQAITNASKLSGKVAAGELVVPAWEEFVAVSAKQAAKAGEQALRFRQTAEKLKYFPKTADEFLSMGPKRAEELWAALDTAFAHNTPEFAGLKLALEDTIDSLTSKVGAKAEAGNPVANLRTAWRVGREARTNIESALAQKAELEAAQKAEKAAMKAAREAEKAASKTPTSKPSDSGASGRNAFERAFSGAKKFMRRSVRQASARGASQAARKAGAGAFGSSMAYQGAGLMAAMAMGGSGYEEGGWLVAAELTGARAAATQRILKAVAAWGPKVGRAVQVLGPKVDPLRRSLDGVEDPETDRKKLFAQRSKELRELSVVAHDRGYATAQQLSSLGHGAFAHAAYKSATSAIGRLMEKLPRDDGTLPWGLDSLWEARPEQIEVFARVYRAVNDPVASVEALLSGDIHVEEAKALREAWPALWGEMKTRMIERLIDPDVRKKLSHGDLTELSITLDMVLSPTQRPQFIAAQQMMYRQRDPLSNPQSSSSGGGTSSASPQQPTAAQLVTQR